MTLNRLLFDHQLALMNAERSHSKTDQESHFDLVEYYAKRIAAWRQNAGLSATGRLND